MNDLLHSSQFIVTAAIFAAALVVISILAWRERRPRETLNPPLLPSTPILLLAGIVAMLALVHLMNLAGLHTGR